MAVMGETAGEDKQNQSPEEVTVTSYSLTRSAEMVVTEHFHTAVALGAGICT